MTAVVALENPPLDALRAKLREMFQLDRGDLDFGIYRVLNQRHAEVERFLIAELPATARATLERHQPMDRAAAGRELDDAVQQLTRLGAPVDSNDTVIRLRAQLAAAPDVASLEREVYSDLVTFFSRYYSDGDFISLRRYKRDSYAIPYEGEEIKL